MRHYRIYRLDPAGHVNKPASVKVAKTDWESVQAVKDLKHPNSVEIWDQAQGVATIDGFVNPTCQRAI